MQNPNKAHPFACNTQTHPLLPQILWLPCFSQSLLHVFFPPYSPGGLLGAVVHCSVEQEQGGGRGGEGGEDIIGIERSLMLIPCTQTILWLFWLIPGPGPSRYCSPTVAGISPDKQLKEL